MKNFTIIVYLGPLPLKIKVDSNHYKALISIIKTFFDGKVPIYITLYMLNFKMYNLYYIKIVLEF